MNDPGREAVADNDRADGLIVALLGEPPSLAAAERESAAGRYARALEHLTVLAGEPERGADRGAVLERGAEACLRSGHPHEALGWAEQLRALQPASIQASLLGAAAAIASDRRADARDALSGLDRPARALTEDERGTASRLWCLLYTRDEDDPAAWAQAQRALAHRVDDGDVWQAIAVLAARADVDVEQVVTMVTEPALFSVAGHLALAQPEGADRLLEALWYRWPDDHRILTGLAILGPRLPLARALGWSARLRAAGMDEHCAVLGRAARRDLPARERIQAAAVAVAAFNDQRALGLLEQTVPEVPDEGLGEVLTDLAELDVPPALESFVVAAANTPARALRVASLLADAGADGAAVSLVGHAATLAVPGSAKWDAAVVSALPNNAARRLRSTVEAAGSLDLAVHLGD